MDRRDRLSQESIERRLAAPKVPVIDQPPPSKRDSWSTLLKPDKWVVNVGFLLLTGGLGGGGLIYVGKQPAAPAPPQPPPQAQLVTQAELESLKAKVNQTYDLGRFLKLRQQGFEDLVGAALYHGPCVKLQRGRTTTWNCGGFKLQGVSVQQARIISESMDPLKWTVDLDGREMPMWQGL